MRSRKKYIKPETTVITVKLPYLLSGSNIEYGKVSPGDNKGTKDNVTDNIVMSKRNPFSHDDSDGDDWNSDFNDAW